MATMSANLFLSAMFCGMTLFSIPALSDNELDSTINWSKLPAIGSKVGAWKFSDKSMPYLLASKYDLKSISTEEGSVLSFVKSVLSGAGVEVGSDVTGLSYFMQRGSDLYRCDEIGLGHRYIVCWQFSPDVVQGKPILTPNYMVGHWTGPSIYGVITWDFEETTVQSTEFEGATSYTVSDQGTTIVVTLAKGATKFTFSKVLQGDNRVHVDYNSPDQSGKLIHLTKDD